MKRTLVCLMVLGAFLALVAAPVSAETLELLTWKGYAPKELIDKFQAETGITVKPTYSNNEEMIAKLRATRGAGFDLAQPSQDRISSVQAEFKIYQPIDYSQLKTDQIVASMLEAVNHGRNFKSSRYRGIILGHKLAEQLGADVRSLQRPMAKLKSAGRECAAWASVT